MTLVLKDRVKETSTSTGTGDFVLAGAETGFQSFASALADGDTTYYAIEDGADWETGLGTWTEATSTLARTTVYESSNSNNAVDWGAGSKNVFITQPASRVATTTVYASADDLPLSGNVQAGDQAFVTGNNRLYLFNGSGWYNIALLNLTPTIDTQPDANYGFDTYGTALTVTLTATDPEGFPLTWSANTTGMTGLATLSQDNNAFTFTPSTDAADQGQSFTATFSVTDGINTAVSNQATFTIGIDQLAEPSVGTLTITSPTGQAVFISGLSALWKNASLSIGTSSTNGLDNSTFIDRSTNNSSIINYGSLAQSAFHPYLDNWSVEFDGSGDYLSNTSTSSTTFGTGDFTIECWVYPTALPASDYGFFIDTRPGGGNNGCALWMTQTDGYLGLFDGVAVAVVNSTQPVPLNQWSHVALVRHGSYLRGYLNGVSVVYRTTSSNFTGDSFWIGTARDNPGSTRNHTGYISNLRIIKGTALYTSTFTPPTEKLTAVSGTELLACQSKRFIDNSSNDHAITVAGNPVVSPSNPFGQESEYATGENKGSLEMTSDGYIRVSTGENLGFFWTLQMWYKFNGNETGVPIPANHYLYDTRTAGSGYAYRTSATNYNFGGSTANIGLTDSNFNDGLWHHLAVVMANGNNGVFLDGVRLGTPISTSINPYIYINSRYSAQYIADISIADLRITNTADFSGVGSTCPVPTSPLGANANTKAYYPFDNAGIYDKTGNNTFVLEDGAQTNTSQVKYASSSVDVQDAYDIISEPNSANILGNTDFTMECWIYPLALSSYQAILSDNIYSSTGGWCLYLYNTALNPWRGGGSIGAGGTLSTNTWQHIAWTREGNTHRAFIDGIEVVNTTNTTTFTDDQVRIGSNPSGYHFNGYIENAQILKGLAKYTSNFTVPDKEQGRNYQAES